MSIFNTKKKNSALKESLRRNIPQRKKRRKQGKTELQMVEKKFLPKSGSDLSSGKSLIRPPCEKQQVMAQVCLAHTVSFPVLFSFFPLEHVFIKPQA